MKPQFVHTGIPITNKKPGMRHVPHLSVWVSNPEDYDLAIEYVKYEEGTPFPEILHKNPHICYKVDDMDPYFEKADAVIWGPGELNETMEFAYIMVDNTIFELQAPKKK